MDKRRMLYISPFWPVKSGVSECSEILIWGLKKYFDITLFIDNYLIENREISKVFPIVHKSDMSERDFKKYDILIYNFGNNPEAHEYMYDVFLNHPGFIVLHDLSLYYLTIGYYQKKGMLYQKIYELEGADGITKVKESLNNAPGTDLLQQKDLASSLLLNNEILPLAKGIFVHSNYTKNQVIQLFPDSNVSVINLVNCVPAQVKKSNYDLRKQFNVKSNEFIVGSIGFIAPSKQCECCCHAIKKYNLMSSQKVHYIMIGEGNYIDHLLDDHIHKTGFLSNMDFFKAISECDFIFNLRYPYHGESSATLLQCMILKKFCIVTNIGWFGELPSDAVLKVSADIDSAELSSIIEKVICSPEDVQPIIERAYEYAANECSVETVALQIKNSIGE